MRKLLLTAAIILFAHVAHGQSQTTNESVSQNEQVDSPKVKVFPNPATSVINILGLLNSNAAQITISDLFGKQVLSHEWEIRNNALNIPITNLESGIYVIIIRSKEQQVKTKFYKQ